MKIYNINDDQVIMFFSKKELEGISYITKEVLKRIEKWEFPIITGFNWDDGLDFSNRYNAMNDLSNGPNTIGLEFKVPRSDVIKLHQFLNEAVYGLSLPLTNEYTTNMRNRLESALLVSHQFILRVDYPIDKYLHRSYD